MSKPELPPLPEPISGVDGPDGPWPIFTSEQATAYGLACYRAGKAEGQAERDALLAVAQEVIDCGGLASDLVRDRVQAAIDAEREKP